MVSKIVEEQQSNSSSTTTSSSSSTSTPSATSLTRASVYKNQQLQQQQQQQTDYKQSADIDLKKSDNTFDYARHAQQLYSNQLRAFAANTASFQPRQLQHNLQEQQEQFPIQNAHHAARHYTFGNVSGNGICSTTAREVTNVGAIMPTEIPREDEERLERIFKQLDRNGDGKIDVHDLSSAMHEFGMSSVYAEKFLQQSDRNQSGSVGFAEFLHYVREHEKNLILQFSHLDKNRDGKVDLEELISAFKDLGLDIDIDEACKLLSRMDKDGSLNISFNEWRDFMLLAASSDIHDLIKFWRHSTASKKPDCPMQEELHLINLPMRFISLDDAGNNDNSNKDENNEMDNAINGYVGSKNDLSLFDECNKVEKRTNTGKFASNCMQLLKVKLGCSLGTNLIQTDLIQTDGLVGRVYQAIQKAKRSQGKKTHGLFASYERYAKRDDVKTEHSTDKCIKYIDIGEDMNVPDDFTQKELQTGLWWRHLVAGGVAGAVSRTCTAPLDRIKMFMQVQTSKIRISESVRLMLNEGGYTSLWRGNGMNVVKIAPETALKFTAYEHFKRLIRGSDNTNQTLTITQRFYAGAAAGGTAQTFIYPMEVLKTRLALRKTGQYSGIIDAAIKIYHREGLNAFYRGYLPNLIGIIPYAGIDLAVYETLKRRYIETHNNDEQPSFLVLLACGSASSTLGQVFAYPLALVRTRLQATSCRRYSVGKTCGMFPACLTTSDASATDTMIGQFRTIIKNEGFFGLYRGMTPNFLKVLPAVSISYVVYEYAGRALGIKMT